MMLLQLNRVAKHFGGLDAVCGLDLTVERGEILGLIGPNGAGKTTVFNLVSGLLPLSSGEIRLEKVSLAGRKPHQIAAMGIARTFQNIRLFNDLTCRENVMVSQYCRTSSGVWSAFFRTRAFRAEEESIREQAERILAFMDLAPYLDVRADNIPYGCQRRLEIARALATRPRLILLDEPAAGMNDAEGEVLVRLIRRLRDQGLTIILIEHDMNLVMNLCDRVAVLNFGQKIADGSPETVQNNPEVIQAYLGREDTDA